nr:MAG TPA: hypothetical protein [Caudoviricetes sp.]
MNGPQPYTIPRHIARVEFPNHLVKVVFSFRYPESPLMSISPAGPDPYHTQHPVNPEVNLWQSICKTKKAWPESPGWLC